MQQVQYLQSQRLKYTYIAFAITILHPLPFYFIWPIMVNFIQVFNL